MKNIAKRRLLSMLIAAALSLTIILSTGILTLAKNSFETERTFESDEGVYSYQYIFENYNVFTFSNLYSAVHNNGSIIVKGDAKHIGSSSNDLIKRDTEKGYIYNYENSITEAPFSVLDSSNYYRNPAAPVFVNGRANIKSIQASVDLFFGASQNTLERSTNEWSSWIKLNSHIIKDDGSLNKVNAYYQDQYVDWDKALTSIVNESNKLIEPKNNDRVITLDDMKYSIVRNENPTNGYVVVNEGESVIISNEVLTHPEFRYVLFVAESGPNNTGPFDTAKTIINYDVAGKFEHIETKWAENEQTKHVSLDYGGYFPGGPETSSHPHTLKAQTLNLIHNYPNVTELVAINGGEGSRFGHVLAPSANVVDSKGNINGSTISKQFVTTSEAHMWPMRSFANVELMDYPIAKVWENGPAAKPTITINLLQNGTQLESVELESGTLSYVFTDLPVYDDKGKAYTYTIEELPVDDYESNVEGSTITNTYTGETERSLSFSKVWIGGPSSKPTITVNLLQNGTKFDSVELINGVLDHTFENLPLYDQSGDEYVYTIEEVPLLDYDTQIEGSTITNTFTGETEVDFSVSKEWLGGGPAVKPTITINLLQNNIKIDSFDLEPGSLTHVFENLPKFDSNGDLYLYSVEEVPVTDYETTVEGSTITNTFTGETEVDFSVSKEWVGGGPALKPTITINLLQNGLPFKSVELINGTLSHTFENLPKYDNQGNLFTYTVEELPVDDYESEVNGSTITNTFTGETEIEFAVNKVWVGGPAVKPTITIEIYQNDRFYAHVDLLDGTLKHTFTNLPKYNSSGEAYVYTVKEQTIVDYDTSIVGDTITNTFTGETEVSFEITKKWLGGPAVKPTIKINLLQNGGTFKSIELINGTLSHTFENLPKFDAQGNEYTYSVEEVPVTDYESEVNGSTITNTFTGETEIDFTINKVWLGGGPAAKPTITIILLQNGTKIDTAELLNGTLSYTFENLTKYDANGNLYEYTVEEVPVNDYDATVDGSTITNTYTGETEVSFELSKVWLGGPAVKPTITINLLQNGVTFESIELNNGTLSHTFDNLPKYDTQGNLYEYSVEETPVVDYESLVDGSTITNTFTGETEVDFTINKEWLGGGPGVKPTITINLLQNGTKIDTVELLNGTLSYTFENLTKYDSNGNLYEYTVEEVPVTDYETKIEGSEITNTFVGETEVSFELSKVWLGGPAVKPTITINLLQNGVTFKSIELNNGTLSHTFDNLPKYDTQGNLYEYSVEETPVVDYESLVDGSTITNTFTGETEIDFTVNKEWLGGGPGVKPTITINLLQNGTKIDTIELLNGTLSHTFENLTKYDSNGNLYEYTVEEVPVTDYETKVEGSEITNTFVGETEVSYELSKVWLGGGPAIKPTITINLLQNGAVFKSINLVNGTLSHRFESLPKYDDSGDLYVYTVEELPVQDYETEVSGSTITNTYTGETTTEYEVTKVWLGGGPTEKPTITVELYRNDVFYASVELPSGTLNHTFTNLPLYDSKGEVYVYSVKELPVEGYVSSINNSEITNTFSGATFTNFTFNKVWVGGPAAKPSITVHLLQDNVVIDTVVLSNTTTHTFEDLPLYNDEGALYVYSVIEDAVDDYESLINGNTITNSFTGETEIDFEITKVWLGGGPGVKPAITINLLQNGTKIDTIELEDGTLTHVFENLTKYDSNGIEYVYTVEEEPVVDYDTTVDDAVITNTYTGITSTEFTVSKVWIGGPTLKPTITVELYQGDALYATMDLTHGTLSHTFTNLPKYNSQGQLYEYSVKEVRVSDYEATIEGSTITNTYTGETEIDFDITKVWLGGGPGVKPTITINLLQNGTKIDSIELLNGTLSHRFVNLDKYDNEGALYEYTVEEVPVTDYDTAVEGSTITNTYTGETTTEYDVTKVWLGGGPTVKPTITIELYQGNALYDMIDLSNGTLSYTFTNLPKYDEHGELYVYSVKEVRVSDYEATIEGSTITNTYTGETEIDFDVTKVWLGGGPGVKPTITINLLQNGTKIDSVELLNGTLSHTFVNLDKYDSEGALYEYTVEEVPVTDYDTVVDGSTITNTYTGETTTEYNVTKVWLGGGPAVKPTITIELYQGNALYDMIDLSNGTLSYTFTNLPMYDEHGELYVYSVKEVRVSDYEANIEGSTITNTYTGETEIDFDVTKVWLGGGPGVKPTITINLLQNGTKIDSVELLNGTLSHTFTNLDKYDNQGALYEYTVEEVPVTDYDTVVDGSTITNTYTGETKTEFSFNKVWLGGPTVKPTITIELYQGNALYDLIDLSNGTLSYTFTDLPKYDEHGELYVYSVKEVRVIDYETHVEGSTITNTYTGETEIDFEVTKVWLGGGPGVKPTITINLLQNGTKVDSVDLLDGTLSHTFVNLDKYDNEGALYEYTVEEVPVTDYDTTVNGSTVINTYTGETEIEFDVMKVWQGGGPALKPTITINLLQNGIKIDSVDLLDGVLSHTFVNLDKYDAAGDLYAYTLEEEAVVDYETTIEGSTITNTYVGALNFDFSVSKLWDNKGPAVKPTIVINLLQNGSKIDSVSLEHGTLTHVFKDLVIYDENGIEYEYTIEEEALEDYEASISGGSIFNKYVGALTVDYEVTKVWVGGPDVKPDITIVLLQNDVKIDEIVLSDGVLKHMFKDLPIYDAYGERFVYEVMEMSVEGYESDIEGSLITNTFVEEVLYSISGYKKDVQTGVNLGGARIELWLVGAEHSYRIAYTDKNGFYEFTGLSSGDYIVIETVAPEGYELDSAPIKVTIEDRDVEDVTFRNTRITTPDKPPVPERPWEDVPVKGPSCDKDTMDKCPADSLPNTGFGLGANIYALGMVALGSLLLLVNKKKEEA